jgi:hypothetical protein
MTKTALGLSTLLCDRKSSTPSFAFNMLCRALVVIVHLLLLQYRKGDFLRIMTDVIALIKLRNIQEVK